MRTNAAERYLQAEPGTMPLAASGPDGAAYAVSVAGRKKYLVMRKGLFHPDRPEEYEVATREIWTNTLPLALHLVDREMNPQPHCRCRMCRTKKKA